MKKAKLIYPPGGGTFYKCNYVINGQAIKRLIINSHYKKKHSSYMNDKLIIKFIEDYLDGNSFYSSEKDGPWEYFELEPILYQDKNYILVWLLNENIPDFLGIVHCRYSNIKANSYEKK